jgi:predicted CxxxxCH...CXXCH cytochrome family protein
MRPIGWSLATLTSLGLGLALSACGDARPAVGGGDGGGGTLCTGCHGTAGRTGTLPGTDANLAAAPPAAPSTEPAAVQAAVIGAHQAHLNPAATGSFTGPIACSECHNPPPTDIAHASSPPASPVHFGTLAKTGGAAPIWNSADKTTSTTCSNVYCHGNFAFGSVTGNTANAPDWTLTNQAACGSCHTLPPAGHITLQGTVTAATCYRCHPGTVDTSGNIIVNASTGQSLHVNGQIDEGAHADPSWLTASGGNHTAAALNQTPPFATCLVCHASFGSADGNPSSSCTDCHASALTGATTADWQQNCVFCHGDKSKLLTYAVADQTGQPWIIAPPTGAQGETATTSLAVGAHQKHVNPATNTLSNAFACSECHTPSLPADIFQTGHLSADGSVPVLLAGATATTGGVQGSFAAPSCSATYCHGNFANGGNNATPAWNGDATASACTSCHGVVGDPNGIAPRTGRHPTNWALHAGFGNHCEYCHNGIATGTTTGTPSIVPAGKALHVNGARNVSFSVGGTWTPNVGSYGGTCAPACHGSETW